MKWGRTYVFVRVSFTLDIQGVFTFVRLFEGIPVYLEHIAKKYEECLWEGGGRTLRIFSISSPTVLFLKLVHYRVITSDVCLPLLTRT